MLLIEEMVESCFSKGLATEVAMVSGSAPGMEALTAAMEPEDTNYYYYVLNPETNQHEFSRTYAEHQEKVAQYASNG